MTLGGGGTDLRSYYSKYGGFVVTTALDKYVYITVNKMFEEKIRLSYSQTEVVDSAEQIKHPVVRETLKLVGLSKSVEIVSIADMPSNTGLGSSGSFGVGLLHALLAFKGEPVHVERLAEETCRIQMDILGEPEGKQDPYIAATGGIISMAIDTSGMVEVSPVVVPDDVVREFQNSLLFFYTGIKRSSGSVLNGEQEAVKRDDRQVVESLHAIKDIGLKVKSALLRGDIEEFGRLQHRHWMAKKSVSSAVSSTEIDRWYELGMSAGALGGKLLGAGGGGFLMFCCPNGRDRVRQAMANEGLREVNFRIGADGTRVVVNL